MSEQLRGLTVAQIREKARADAQQVLDRWWPPGHLPVDPVYLARSMGVSVFSAQLGDDTWGMLVGSGAGQADIYLDKDQPEVRFRFSCAHELGHFVERGEALQQQAFIDRRSDGGRGHVSEIYANEFAGSLLMPELEMVSAIRRGETDWDLADRFGVSTSAAAYRRRLLGHLVARQV